MLKPQQSIERLHKARRRKAKREAEEAYAAKANEAYEKHCNNPSFLRMVREFSRHGAMETAVLSAATMTEYEEALEARKSAEADKEQASAAHSWWRVDRWFK